jgi:hypothetical protein
VRLATVYGGNVAHFPEIKQSCHLSMMMDMKPSETKMLAPIVGCLKLASPAIYSLKVVLSSSEMSLLITFPYAPREKIKKSIGIAKKYRRYKYRRYLTTLAPPLGPLAPPPKESWLRA